MTCTNVVDVYINYGVGAANLIFLPVAGKLKIRMHEEHVIREMTIEGVVSILEGMNPRILETKLLGFLADQRPLPREIKAAELLQPLASRRQKKESSRQSRTLADFLRRLHHAVICAVCRYVFRRTGG